MIRSDHQTRASRGRVDVRKVPLRQGELTVRIDQGLSQEGHFKRVQSHLHGCGAGYGGSTCREPTTRSRVSTRRRLRSESHRSAPDCVRAHSGILRNREIHLPPDGGHGPALRPRQGVRRAGDQPARSLSVTTARSRDREQPQPYAGLGRSAVHGHRPIAGAAAVPGDPAARRSTDPGRFRPAPLVPQGFREAAGGLYDQFGASRWDAPSDWAVQ